jgi:hypothetical protein
VLPACSEGGMHRLYERALVCRSRTSANEESPTEQVTRRLSIVAGRRVTDRRLLQLLSFGTSEASESPSSRGTRLVSSYRSV